MGDSSGDFVEYVKEQLASIRHLGDARFFGGIGLTSDGVQFAMVMDNALYFVVDKATRVHYERLGSTCFSYETKNGRVNVKRYFEVPAQAIEDPAQFLALARQALAIAQATTKKPARRAKPATA